MAIRTSYKIYLIILLMVMAVVLCTLPFVLPTFDEVYVFTKNKIVTSEERGFINELKKVGYKVYVNKNDVHNKKVAIWFKSLADVRNIMQQTSFYKNFIYIEDYYPFNWENLKDQPIILTPYQELYEHYMRLNIKSATFTLGGNLSEFHPLGLSKKYDLVYYEQRRDNTLLSEYLRTQNNIYFLGKFWNNGIDNNASSEDIAKNDNKILSQAKVVIIDNYEENKVIPREIINATASGALVITSHNASIYEIYGDSIVYYSNYNEIMPLANYYAKMTDVASKKANKAQQITTNKLSSINSVKRFSELYEWMKEN